MMAGAALVLTSFAGSIGSALQTPLRNLLANSWMIRTDAKVCWRWLRDLEYVLIVALGRAAPAAGAGSDRRQHGAAPAGVVRRIAQAEAQQAVTLAGAKRIFEAGGGQLRQGPVQGDRARRGDGHGAVAGRFRFDAMVRSDVTTIIAPR